MYLYVDEKIGWIIVQDTDTYMYSMYILHATPLFILFWHEHYPHDIKLLYEMTMKQRCSFWLQWVGLLFWVFLALMFLSNYWYKWSPIDFHLIWLDLK